jgi:hypothetical protein
VSDSQLADRKRGFSISRELSISSVTLRSLLSASTRPTPRQIRREWPNYHLELVLVSSPSGLLADLLRECEDTSVITSSDHEQSRLVQWIRWVLLVEGLFLLWALAGPGYRHAIRHRGDHALFARWVMEAPGYLDAVLVNFVAMHIFVAGAWLAAWVVTRLRSDD